MAVPGYKLISRRDRHENERRGGIMTLVRTDCNGLSHISDRSEEEHSWQNLATELIVVGSWYRSNS